MKNLKESVIEANDELVRKEEARELALVLSRDIIRKTKNAIHEIHVGKDNGKTMLELENDMDSMVSKLDDSSLRSGPVKDAMMEYAEASIFTAVYLKDIIPSYKDLNIDASSWVLGLADVVGELRRLVLTCLVDADYDNAKYYFQCMDEITEEIMMYDIADTVSSIRKKQDAVRAIMERTRSDYSNGMIMKR